MSVYSSTPAPPSRIRIVSHPPLAPLKAWLPLPLFSPNSNEPATVKDLLSTVKGMLRTEQQLEMELQGFALFDESPLSILDPTNDILDIKLVSTLRSPAPESKPPQLSPKPLPPSSIPLPASPSASSSSSSSSSSSDEDEPPESLPSKRPLPNTAKNESHRPSKRAKIDPISKPPSSSSSSTSTSSSSDGSSDSSSDSSDSDSDSDSDSTPVQSTSAAKKPPATNQSSPVIPGEGLKRTHKRNLRKRVLRIARAIERNAKNEGGVAVNGKESQEVSVIKGGVKGKENEGAKEGKGKAGKKGIVGESESEKMELDNPPVPSTDSAPTSTAASQIVAPTKQPSQNPKDPYSDYSLPSLSSISHLAPPTLRNGSEPGQSLVGPGSGQNTSHSTSIIYSQPQSSTLGGSPLRPEPTPSTSKKSKKPKSKQSLVMDRGERRASPSYAPKSPNLSPAQPPPPKKKETPQYPPRFPFPSKRRDLPPWMVVTSVNVEKRDWLAGVGKRIRGTSKEWRGSEEAVEEEDGEGFEGWIGKEEVEGMWAGFKKIEQREGKKGMRVASKVLELDPLTFNPTLSLKYGRLLSPTPEHTLRIQLHPSCLLPAPEEVYYEEEEEQFEEGEEDEEYSLKKKMKFGQDALDGDEQGDSGVWEGDWSGDVRLIK